MSDTADPIHCDRRDHVCHATSAQAMVREQKSSQRGARAWWTPDGLGERNHLTLAMVGIGLGGNRSNPMPWREPRQFHRYRSLSEIGTPLAPADLEMTRSCRTGQNLARRSCRFSATWCFADCGRRSTDRRDGRVQRRRRKMRPSRDDVVFKKQGASAAP